MGDPSHSRWESGIIEGLSEMSAHKCAQSIKQTGPWDDRPALSRKQPSGEMNNKQELKEISVGSAEGWGRKEKDSTEK